MHRRQFTLAALSCTIAATLPGCIDASSAARGTETVAGHEDARLNALLDRMYQAQLRTSPEYVSAIGLDEKIASARRRLDDRSVAARDRFGREQRAFLRELDTIDRQRLSATAAIQWEAARYPCALYAQGARQFGYGAANASRPYAVSQRTGAYYEVPELLASVHAVDRDEDADAYLARLIALPAAIDQDTERARADAAQGVIPPDFVLDRTLAQLKAMRDAPVSDNALIAPLSAHRAATSRDRDRTAQATQAMEGPLRESLNRQIALLETWRPRASDRPSVSRLPEGEAYYRWALQLNTTTQTTAEELHREAAQHVEALSARMDAVLRAQGLSEGSIGERYLALSKQPRHRYPKTDAGRTQRADDLDARVRDMQTRLPNYFGALPKATPAVRRDPPRLEYFHPGVVEGAKPNVMLLDRYGIPDLPQWEWLNTVYHESAPGHHLQSSLALESPTVSNLSRISPLRAYTEGWSVYCEQLVQEMGVYDDDPLLSLGPMRSALVRNAHIVIDTGLHALGWSRDRAVAYATRIGGDADAAAHRVDRCCVIPAETILYAFGRTRWLGLRARAQQRLGANFDLRAFHDEALRHGALPIDTLERVMDAWIARQIAG